MILRTEHKYALNWPTQQNESTNSQICSKLKCDAVYCLLKQHCGGRSMSKNTSKLINYN